MCLGGLWDNMFLYFIEQHPDCTLGELFGATKVSVAQSSTQNVSEFGDLSFRDRKVSEFFGKLPSKPSKCSQKSSGSVATSDVELHLAKQRAIRAEGSRTLSIAGISKRSGESNQSGSGRDASRMLANE